MRILQKLLLCFIACWLVASPAWAAPLDAAKAAFSKGDYKKAGKLASQAGRKLKSRSDKAEAMALIGAVSMKLGKSGKSRFRKALKLDPGVRLPAGAEKDAKIRKAFASAKKSGTKVSSRRGRSSSDRITKTASAGDRSPSNFKNYIPFGVNSYMQGKTLTAVALGGAQLGGLFLYVNRTSAASTANSDAKTVIAEAEAADATDTPEFIQFLDDNDAFVKKANSEASLALMLMAGGYALSVVDALFDPLGTSTAALEVDSSKQAYADLGTRWEDRRIDSSWKFDFQLVPSREPGLVLSAKQSF